VHEIGVDFDAPCLDADLGEEVEELTAPESDVENG
jgi:hypothetical protein